MSDLERRALLGVAGIGAIAALSKAGPLNPPAGAVSPTGRTTDEIYDKIPNGIDGRIPIAASSAPVTISAPGSYILTGNVSVAANLTGITVAADNVTLDLNGYSVIGVPGSTSGIGVILATSQRRFVLRNGTISGFNTGVALGVATNTAVVEDLLIEGCRTYGILASSPDVRSFRIRRCTIVDTGLTHTGAGFSGTIAGITLTGVGHTVEDCTISRVTFGGVGSPDLRGISFASASVGNVAARNVIGSNVTPSVTGRGIIFVGAGVYRDNVVTGYTLPYTAGTDGGGNV